MSQKPIFQHIPERKTLGPSVSLILDHQWGFDRWIRGFITDFTLVKGPAIKLCELALNIVTLL